MYTLKSKSQINKRFRISNGKIIETNDAGVTNPVSDETMDLLLTKYSFKEFVLSEGDEIEKVEKSEPLRKDEVGEPLKQEEDEGEELKNIIRDIDDFNSLKQVAKDLELPEEEWKNKYRRKDYFKNYLLSKVAE
tara:strand:+ start:11773 stop:12174 length:402 start_codon:yes stop_codon:yes gene_type:complete